VLDNLNDVPAAEVEVFIENFRKGFCPSCNKFCELDIHRSFRVHSILVYTKWSTQSELSCRECARKRQRSDLQYCIAMGWWGLPFGPVITFVQIIRNVVALRRGDTPSSDICRAARLALAEHVARARNAVQAS
jgi:hypothetical protein